MFTKDSLIFVVDDDAPYGSLVQMYLERQGFRNVAFFQNEGHCLSNMHSLPNVVITDYDLGYMSGLKLIDEARKIYRGFYSILLSGAYHKAIYSNDIPLRHIDKYIMKGNNDLAQLSETLSGFLTPGYCCQYY